MSPHYTAAKPRNLERNWRRWFEWRQVELGGCCYCGVRLLIPADVDQNEPRQATREHTLPQSRGGHAWLWCCLKCNSDKAALTVNEYRAALIVRHRRPVVFHFERELMSSKLIDIVRLMWLSHGWKVMRALQ